jgi:dipeptidyl aminopeptidase/acylaminoacyl peptidase
VAAESPFSNFREIAYDRVGQYFYTGPWLGRTILRPLVEVAFFYGQHKYGLDLTQVSPEDVVAAAKIPVLLIHGKDDTNIPIRHSRRIQAHNANVVLWEVPYTDHCGAISTHPEEFQERLLNWFTSHRDVRVRPGT